MVNDDEGTVRIQFELPQSKMDDLSKMMRLGQIDTRKDLFNNALTILQWAIEEKMKGRIIASVDEENKRYKELVMPILQAAAKSPDDIFRR